MNTRFCGSSFQALSPLFLALFFCSIGAQSQVPTIERIGTLGGSLSITWGINAQGEVIGSSPLPGDVEQHAFIFRGGAIQDLGTLGGGYSVAVAINNSSQVVGLSYTASLRPRGVSLRAWHYAEFGHAERWDSEAIAINDAGQVVGSSPTAETMSMHAFRYSDGQMTDLGTLGGPYSSAVMINSQGWVTGNSATADGNYRAFMLDPHRDGQRRHIGRKHQRGRRH